MFLGFYGATYGVHTNHLAYTETLARFVDLREAQLKERFREKLKEKGTEPLLEDLSKLSREALAAEIPEITRVLKEKILQESVLGDGKEFMEINDLFGEKVKNMPDVPFTEMMNQFFGID